MLGPFCQERKRQRCEMYTVRREPADAGQPEVRDQRRPLLVELAKGGIPCRAHCDGGGALHTQSTRVILLLSIHPMRSACVLAEGQAGAAAGVVRWLVQSKCGWTGPRVYFLLHLLAVRGVGLGGGLAASLAHEGAALPVQRLLVRARSCWQLP